MRIYAKVLGFFLVLFAPAPSFANTVYQIDVPLSLSNTDAITGKIITDGNTGTLTASDIVLWDVTATIGARSDRFTGNNPNPFNGSTLTLEGAGLSATPTELFYNFSTPLSLLEFADAADDIFLINTGTGGEAFAGLDLFSPFLVTESLPLSGQVEIGAVGGAVPLPAALPLFATGLAALGLLGWRRKRKAQAVA